MYIDPTVTDSAVNEEIKVEAIDQLENIEAINSDNDDLTESKERPRVLTKETLVKLWQNRLPKAEIIFLSAQSQMNINTLKEKLLKHLDMVSTRMGTVSIEEISSYCMMLHHEL